MNYWTREIAKILDVSLEEARKVQDEMECNGFDFSECTDRIFKRDVKLTALCMSIR